MTKLQNIKDWCSAGYGCPRVKLEKITNDGFIYSKTKEIKAGMEVDLVSSKMLTIPLRTIKKVKVYFKCIYIEATGEIYHDGIVKNI